MGGALRILVVVLFVGSIVAWFVSPTRHVDWIPVFISALVAWAAEMRVSALEKRLNDR
jgi:hypothetical protein